jgi:hypothetical protein
MLAAATDYESRLHAQIRFMRAMLPQVSTCADVSPVKQPGVKFACPSDTEFNPAMAEAVAPRAKSCCKVRRGQKRSAWHVNSVFCRQRLLLVEADHAIAWTHGSSCAYAHWCNCRKQQPSLPVNAPTAFVY